MKTTKSHNRELYYKILITYKLFIETRGLVSQGSFKNLTIILKHISLSELREGLSLSNEIMQYFNRRNSRLIGSCGRKRGDIGRELFFALDWYVFENKAYPQDV
jgi:hypothetical protein